MPGLEELAYAIQVYSSLSALLLGFMSKEIIFPSVSLKNSSFVPVRRENPSASEFADPHTDPVTSELFLDFE